MVPETSLSTYKKLWNKYKTNPKILTEEEKDKLSFAINRYGLL